MGKVGTGAIAGAIAGLAWGILGDMVGLISKTLFKIVAGHAASINVAALYNQALNQAIIIRRIIGGLIIGIILVIIFAYAHNKIPGKNMVVKGEVFGLILWIIFGVLIGLIGISFGIVYYLILLLSNIIPLLVFGFILGVLYNKWEIKDKPITDEEFNMETT